MCVIHSETWVGENATAADAIVKSTAVHRLEEVLCRIIVAVKAEGGMGGRGTEAHVDVEC